MKDITTFLTNYTTPSAGFSLGRLKDDPGDGTGSGLTVEYGNDWLYGFYAPILKYKGAVSGSDESETASDMLDALELAVGIQNENTTDIWDNSTSYAQDDHVMYNGIQFVSMVAANLGNNPFTNPVEWLPCLDRDKALHAFHKGEAINGGFLPLHDKRNATYYREWFEWGLFNYGGNAGNNFKCYGVHLDGQTLTGDPDYVAIFNIGESDEYHLLDTLAPDVMGTRTLLDTKGRVARVVDDSVDTEDLGVTQEDKFQGHNFQLGYNSGSSYQAGATNYVLNPAVAPNVYVPNFIKNIITDGVNGAPRVGSETVMKNYTEGIPILLVMIAA